MMMVVVVMMMMMISPPIGVMMVMVVVVVTNNDELRHLLTRFRGCRPLVIDRLQKGYRIWNGFEQFRKGVSA